MDAALAEQLERLADWMIGGAGVLCALIALRAASGGSWPVRLILGPVAVGSVMAAFLALLVFRPPLEWPGAGAARVVEEQSRPAPAAIGPKEVQSEAAANVPSVSVPASVRVSGDSEGDAAAAAMGVAKPRTEAEQQGRVLLYATDRARSDRNGRAGYDSQGAGRLELGRVQMARPRRSAMASARSPAASDAAAGEAAPVTQVAIAPMDGGAWRQALATLMAAAPGGRERHAVVVVHGFDTAFEDAVGRASRLAERIQAGLPVVVYSWPSGSRVASYSLDRDNAKRAAPFLAETVKSTAGPDGAETVSLAGFGLGCRTLLDALEELAKAPSRGAALGEVALIAPDLEAGDLVLRLAALKGVARGITIYAGAGDRNLDISRRFNGGVMPGGGVPESGPLVLPGVATIDATGAAEDAVAKDIALLLVAGERDPGRRNLEKAVGKGGDDAVYWRFRAGP